MIADALIRIGSTILTGVIELLPEAADTEWPELPAIFHDYAATFLGLDRYLPIHEMVAVATLAITIRGALFALWVASFIYSKLPGKAT